MILECRITVCYCTCSILRITSSDGSFGPYGPGDQASQGGPGGQVVRWSGDKNG